MNPIFVLLLTIAIWFIAVLEGIPVSLMLLCVIITIGLRYVALVKCKLIPSRDPLLLLTLLPSISLILYVAMFSLVDVKTYLEIAEQERDSSVANGCNFLFSMFFGGALHLSLIQRGHRIQAPIAISRSFNTSLMLAVAWLPLVVASVCYFIFFQGRDYVAIHSDVPLIANLLLKSLYFSYPAAFFLASSLLIPEHKRNIYLLQLLAGHVLVFSVLYMLRSPAVFFMFIVLFILGHRLSARNVLFVSVIIPIALSVIAILRDPSLIEINLQLSIFNLVVTFGDFADALRFAKEHVEVNGSLWGRGILDSFLGLSEPLANKYAKSIDLEYFESGGGFGFFILADIFVNFGFFFGIVFSIFIGYILSWLAKSKFGSMRSYVACIMFASSLALTRNDVGSTMRGVVYCFVAYLIVRAFTRRAII